jgi:hypothetical protein
MTTYELILIIGAVCSVIIVLGSMVLLYKGIITLKEKGEGAVSVEYKNIIKFTSTYPALGLFVIGLIFFATTVFLGRPTEVKPIYVEGVVKVEDPQSVTIKMYFQPSMFIPGSDGNIKGELYPLQKIISAEAVAPGYSKPNVKKDLDVSQKIVLGTFEFGDLIVTKPEVDPRNIIDTTGDLAPLSVASF